MRGPEEEVQQEILWRIRTLDALSRLPTDPPDEMDYERDDDE